MFSRLNLVRVVGQLIGEGDNGGEKIKFLNVDSPRSLYYEGCFDVYINHKKIYDYVLKKEKMLKKSYLVTDDQMFDPSMITFKCRLYVHKDRKRLVRYLLRRKALLKKQQEL